MPGTAAPTPPLLPKPKDVVVSLLLAAGFEPHQSEGGGGRTAHKFTRGNYVALVGKQTTCLYRFIVRPGDKRHRGTVWNEPGLGNHSNLEPAAIFDALSKLRKKSPGPSPTRARRA